MKYEKESKELNNLMSPSSQRVWIEITRYDRLFAYCDKSPSSQRVWIEIVIEHYLEIFLTVALFTEGVD